MKRCLPIPAFWWYPEPFADGPRRIVVPADTPVRATCAGRVTKVDDQAVGAVVVRDEYERFHHYRRLRASTIMVAESDEVEQGAVLGVVASPNDGSTPALLYGVHDANDKWIDIVDLFAGAMDPAIIGAVPDLPGSEDRREVLAKPSTKPVTDPPRARVREPAAPTSPAPLQQIDPVPPAPAEEPAEEPAVADPAPMHPATSASSAEPLNGAVPVPAEAAPEGATPAEPPPAEPQPAEPRSTEAPPPAAATELRHEEADAPDADADVDDAKPRRSKLAARRPPRRSS